jgi:sugar phosphate isomerase/epimerase
MDPTRRALLFAAAAIPFAPRGSRRRNLANLPRISLAQWSFHRALRAGELDHLDFAKKAKEGFGLEGVEYVNQFFKDKAANFGYLAEMKKRAEGVGVKSLLIMCDGEGSLGAADPPERHAAIENHFKWIAAAAYLGCHSIRVNAYGSGSPEDQMASMADSLHRLATVADGYGLNVIVENHGGLSSDGSWLSGVMKKADHPRVGTLPDLGNFTIEKGQDYDRYKGVAEMIPWAKAFSAKSYDFDEQGNETTIDYFKMAKIAVDAKYKGWVGVEYEGEHLSEPDGVTKTIELVKRAFAKALEPK